MSSGWSRRYKDEANKTEMVTGQGDIMLQRCQNPETKLFSGPNTAEFITRGRLMQRNATQFTFESFSDNLIVRGITAHLIGLYLLLLYFTVIIIVTVSLSLLLLQRFDNFLLYNPEIT